MKSLVAIVPLVLVLALAACRPESPPESGAAASQAADNPVQDVPPATAPVVPADDAPPALPPGTTPDGDRALARFDGYGDMRFGMPVADFRQAWGGELKGEPSSEGAEGCYHLAPVWVGTPAELAFMMDGGKFVRVSTEASKLEAPGGGKVGMSKDEIAKLYPGRVEEQPHKYTDGRYLRIKDTASANVLIFETDAAGKVTEWRVGVPPQVDYVEGCA